MNNAIDLAIVDKVIKKMNLPRNRKAVPAKVTQRSINRVLSMLGPEKPSEICRLAFAAHFLEIHATENECLQAWALYFDYKSMASLYGLQKKRGSKRWGGGGLSVAS